MSTGVLIARVQFQTLKTNMWTKTHLCGQFAIHTKMGQAKLLLRQQDRKRCLVILLLQSILVTLATKTLLEKMLFCHLLIAQFQLSLMNILKWILEQVQSKSHQLMTQMTMNLVFVIIWKSYLALAMTEF